MFLALEKHLVSGKLFILHITIVHESSPSFLCAFSSKAQLVPNQRCSRAGHG